MQTLEEAFAHHGAPRHLITDQGGVFVSGVLSDLLIRGHVKHRLGAVGQHGSVAVTERAILTLKYEWLRRVPATRGLDHLSRLLRHFGIYYNEYRGHATLGGAAPAANDRGERRNKPAKSVRTASTGAE